MRGTVQLLQPTLTSFLLLSRETTHRVAWLPRTLLSLNARRKAKANTAVLGERRKVLCWLLVNAACNSVCPKNRD